MCNPPGGRPGHWDLLRGDGVGVGSLRCRGHPSPLLFPFMSSGLYSGSPEMLFCFGCGSSGREEPSSEVVYTGEGKPGLEEDAGHTPPPLPPPRRLFPGAKGGSPSAVAPGNLPGAPPPPPRLGGIVTHSFSPPPPFPPSGVFRYQSEVTTGRRGRIRADQ